MNNNKLQFELEIEKSSLYTLGALILVVLSAVVIHAQPFGSHSGDEIEIDIPAVYLGYNIEGDTTSGRFVIEPEEPAISLQSAIEGPYLNPEKRSIPYTKFYSIDEASAGGTVKRINVGNTGACFLTSMLKINEDQGVQVTGGAIARSLLVPGGVFTISGSSSSIRSICGAQAIDASQIQNGYYVDEEGVQTTLQIAPGETMLTAKRAICHFVCMDWHRKIDGTRISR